MSIWLRIIIIYLITGLISTNLLIHLHWLIYASEEKLNQYYEHPIFDADKFEPFWLFHNIIGIIIRAFTFPIFCFMELIFITGGYDSFTVFIDHDIRKKKQWWRFWRWGMKKFPKGFSPLKDCNHKE